MNFKDPAMVILAIWIGGTMALGLAGFTGLALLCGIASPVALIFLT